MSSMIFIWDHQKIDNCREIHRTLTAPGSDTCPRMLIVDLLTVNTGLLPDLLSQNDISITVLWSL
jgi:hypothetical protein